MAHVVLFHHALGLTAGVEAFGDRLRAAGHEVTMPDLYVGERFETIGAGVEHAERVGFDRLLTRAAEAVEALPPDVTFAGFSLGALAAQHLAQTRPGATGALLYHHGDVPVDVLGNAWPSGVPVQIHIAEGDEFREEGVPEQFVADAAEVAPAELFLYPGDSHLFADSTLEGYDAEATDLVIERSLELLG